MEVSKFIEKFNKIEGNSYTFEEEVIFNNGVYVGYLEHDNVVKESIAIYTGSKLTGTKMKNYFLSSPTLAPWKYQIKIYDNSVTKAYISYETTGDTVEAEDINNLQNEIVRTQEAVNTEENRSINKETEIENNLNKEINRATAKESEIDTELLNRYKKDETFSKEEVMQKISDLVNSAPETLDTLKEIADALGNDPNFSTTIINLLGNKVDTEEFNKIKELATHSNKETLDKFSEDADGNPLYNNKKIVANFDTSEIDDKINALNDLKLRSHVGNKLDYLYASLPSTISVASTINKNLKFTSINSNNLSIEEDGSIILKANKKYKIYLSIISSSTSNCYTYGLYKNDNVIPYSYGFSVSAAYTGSSSTLSTKPSVVVAEFDEDTPITIKGVNNIGNGTITHGSIIINEIGREVLINEVEEVAKAKHIEDTPVGHIMSIMGLNAPPHYLICDGSEYNIIDYPKLAEYFKNELGSINYFGGDGINTFAVPDMRGEFLRGYDSTNIKDPEGSIRGIGKHQDATEHVKYFSGSSLAVPANNIQKTLTALNPDSILNKSKGYISTPLTGSSNVNAFDQYFTSRPTNVNVLWCIKYEPTYFMNYSPIYGGFDETVLFEGEATSAGEYALLDDINNYEWLDISCSLSVSSNVSVHNNKQVIRIHVSDVKYTNAELTYNVSLSTATRRILFGFKDENTLRIDSINLTENTIIARIEKIIGIRPN